MRFLNSMAYRMPWSLKKKPLDPLEYYAFDLADRWGFPEPGLMLKSMSVRTFLKWPQYYRQRADRADQAVPAELPQQSTEEMITILDRYKGALGG